MEIKARFLLDTSVLIWSISQQQLISAPARAAISDPDASVRVSIVSVWEMQIKHSQGKLILPQAAQQVAGKYLTALDAELLPLNLEHIGVLHNLPYLHKDPFDRMLLAQCRSEGLTFISPDRALQGYNVPILW